MTALAAATEEEYLTSFWDEDGSLVPRHHRLVHEGGYTVEPLSGGGVRFRRPCGSPVPDVAKPPPGSRRQLVERNCRSGLAIRRSTAG